MIRRVHHGNVKKNSEITFKFGVKKEYRRGLREQFRSTEAGLPTETLTAAAAVSPAGADLDSSASGGCRTRRDGDETKLLAVETGRCFKRPSHVVDQLLVGTVLPCVVLTLYACSHMYVNSKYCI